MSFKKKKICDQAGCLLQKRRAMSILQLKKTTCLLTVFLKMYTEVCMCSSVYIMALHLYAEMTELVNCINPW